MSKGYLVAITTEFAISCYRCEISDTVFYPTAHEADRTFRKRGWDKKKVVADDGKSLYVWFCPECSKGKKSNSPWLQ